MSKLSIVICALLTGLGISALATAQNVASTAEAPASHAVTKSASTAHPVPKPGNRNCLRDTGSLIPAKKGECLPVAGRSYSGDELRRTGMQNNARALQTLDPSISVGH
jgi:hypothetical protein